MLNIKRLYRENNVYKGYLTIDRFCIRWCVPKGFHRRLARAVHTRAHDTLYKRRWSIHAYKLPGHLKNCLYKEEDLLKVYRSIIGELPKKAICPEEYMTVAQAQALFGVTIIRSDNAIKKYCPGASKKYCKDGSCSFKYRYDALCHTIASLDPTVIPNDMMVRSMANVNVSLIVNSSAKAAIAAFNKKYPCIVAEEEVQHGGVMTAQDAATSDCAKAGEARNGQKLVLTCDGEQVFSLIDYTSMVGTKAGRIGCKGICGLKHRIIANNALPVGVLLPNVDLYKRSDLDRAFTDLYFAAPVMTQAVPKEYMSLWDFRSVCNYLPPSMSTTLYEACQGYGWQVPCSSEKPACKQDSDASRLLFRIDVLCTIASLRGVTHAVDLDSVMSPELKALVSGFAGSYKRCRGRSKHIEALVRAIDGKTINFEYVTPSSTPVQEPTPEPAPAAEQQVPAIRNASDVRAAVEIFAESMQSMEKIIKEQAELLRLIAKGMSGQDK